MIKKIFYFAGVISVIISTVIISSCLEASSKSKVDTHWTKYSGNPIYWSKCESIANITTAPDIRKTGLNDGTYSGTSIISVSPKTGFGSYLYAGSSTGGNPGGKFANWYPLGNTFTMPDKGTLSFWMMASGFHGFFLDLGGFQLCWSNTGEVTLSINSNTYTYSSYTTTDSKWNHIYILWDKNYDGNGNTSIKVFLNHNDTDTVKIFDKQENPASWISVDSFEFIWWDSSGSLQTVVSLDNVKLWDSIITEDASLIKQIGDSENYVNIVTTGSN